MNHTQLQFPFEIVDVDPVLNKQLLQDFTGEKTGFVQVGPEKWFFPSGYAENAERYYNFEARRDDIWVISFPRSGTTWTQELVWLLANDLNYEHASRVALELRFPFLEFSSFFHPEVKQQFLDSNADSSENCAAIELLSKPVWKTLQHKTDRRFIKSHLPFDLLHPELLKKGCKIVYIARNVKDVAVSFYHLNKLFRTQGYVNDFQTYWQYFRNGLQPWTPYWSHIKQAWNLRDNKNLLFLFYEDMSQNTEKSIKRVADFLEVNYSQEELEKLQEHLKIHNFKNNQSVNGDWLSDLGITARTANGFVRNGRNGESKEYFSGHMAVETDQWIRDNLANTDLYFPTV